VGDIVKDLFVSVLSPEKEFGPGFTSILAVEIPPDDDPASMALFVAELKKQLDRALDEIARDPKKIAERLRPHTLRHVEMLERKFDEAQAELRRLKNELSKGR
jgi:hypothetical protein